MAESQDEAPHEFNAGRRDMMGERIEWEEIEALVEKPVTVGMVRRAEIRAALEAGERMAEALARLRAEINDYTLAAVREGAGHTNASIMRQRADEANAAHDEWRQRVAPRGIAYASGRGPRVSAVGREAGPAREIGEGENMRARFWYAFVSVSLAYASGIVTGTHLDSWWVLAASVPLMFLAGYVSVKR